MNMIGITTISSIPDSCLNCVFKAWHVEDGFVCPFTEQQVGMDGRLDDCPLIEITVEDIEEEWGDYDIYFEAFMNQGRDNAVKRGRK